jgi:hypothetical protein
MTITIAALCDASNKAQTGNFIMCADTLITWCANGLPISSKPNGSKIYDLPHGFYAAIACDISQSHQIISYLHPLMASLQASDPNFVDLVKLALEQTAEYVRLWMRREVLADYNVSLKEFLESNRLARRNEITKEINERILPTQMIVAGFTSIGRPMLFFSNGVNTEEQTNPGYFCCGGAGANAAMDWLNFRGQNSFMSTPRTFYHIREAKQFSEVCPIVGRLNNTLLLRHNKEPVDLSSVTPGLDVLFKNMFPRTTDALDNPDKWDWLVSEYGVER